MLEIFISQSEAKRKPCDFTLYFSGHYVICVRSDWPAITRRWGLTTVIRKRPLLYNWPMKIIFQWKSLVPRFVESLEAQQRSVTMNKKWVSINLFFVRCVSGFIRHLSVRPLTKLWVPERRGKRSYRGLNSWAAVSDTPTRTGRQFATSLHPVEKFATGSGSITRDKLLLWWHGID